MTAPPVSRRTQQRKQFLFNVFVTALEGGIGYWSLASKYHWRRDDAPDNISTLDAEDLDGFYAVIHEITDADPDGSDDLNLLHKPDRLGILPGDYYKSTPIRIDAEAIERGIRLFKLYCLGAIDDQGKQVDLLDIKCIDSEHYWNQFLVADSTNGQDGDYDAGVADVIVQFAAFGKVVYG